MTTHDLIVIGGGLHGCAAALFAARAGLRVTLLERDTIGRHASGVNAGGVRRLNRDPAEIPLSCRAMELWHRLPQIVDDDCGFHGAPQIRVAESDEELASLAARVRKLRKAGFEHEILIDRDELRQRLPAIASHCVGASMSMDGYAEPLRTTAAFARRARTEGVEIHEGQRVRSLRHERGRWRFDTDSMTLHGARLLNCAGAWGGHIAGQLGDHAPVEAIAPLMLVTQRMAPFCSAVVGTAGRPLSFKQMPNGTVVIGGARLGRANLVDGETTLDFGELRETARTARDLFPIMAGAAIQRAWSGVEGRTPDRLPIIGPSRRYDTAFHAFGFSAHGFQLGPAVGLLMAELISSGRIATELTPFSLDRFAV